MKTIFNTSIEVESQEQADRLKQVCIDNGLPYWDDKMAFKKDDEYKYFVMYSDEFWLQCYVMKSFTKVTETEWMELLKEYKNEKN